VVKLRYRWFAALLIAGAMTAAANAQETSDRLSAAVDAYEAVLPVPAQGLVTDWSHHALVFSAPSPGSPVLDDPRYWQQEIRRSLARNQEGIFVDAPILFDAKAKKQSKKIRRDWSVALGTGATVGAGQYPAKYSFSVTGTPSCSNDFVVFNTGLTGSGSQASIIAFNKLYAGASPACGTSGVPATYWQYNTGGRIITSVVLSLDGSQVAFVHSPTTGAASLVILKWKASATLVSPTGTIPSNYRSCTAPCMTTITFGNASADSLSSPFYVYSGTHADTIYVGDDAGFMHQFTGVFNGTPGEVTSSPWPAQNSVTKLSSPVYDSGSNEVLISAAYDGNNNGARIHETNAATGAVTNSAQLGPTGTGTPLTVAPPLVDSTAGMAYFFVANDSSNNSAVYQMPSSNVAATPTEITLGTGSTSGNEQFFGAFDNPYFSSTNGAKPTGGLWVCGNTGGNPTLYKVPITAGSPGSATTIKALTNHSATCSPVTEFFNSGSSVDWLFMSVTASGNLTGCTGACVYSFNINSTPSSNTAGLAATGGSSGIIVDNASTQTGASQVYYSTVPATTATGSAVQAAQSGL